MLVSKLTGDFLERRDVRFQNMEGLVSSQSLRPFIPMGQYYLNTHIPSMPVGAALSSQIFSRYHPRHQQSMMPPFLGYPEPISPLDLSVKTSISITPPCTPPPSRKVMRKNENNNDELMSPRSDDKIDQNVSEKCIDKNEHIDVELDNNSPEDGFDDSVSKKRRISVTHDEDEDTNRDSDEEPLLPSKKMIKYNGDYFVEPKTPDDKDVECLGRESPDIDIMDVEDKPKKIFPKTASTLKKSKAVRRLQFDEDKSSPVSGTIIRELADDETLVVRKGDIDPAFNVVEITEEAKATLASIENKLGSYICRLCRQLYEDAFTLAQHRCSRIVHIEYRCPECDKVFNCPANLASHRRWHKPRVPGGSKVIRKVQPAPVQSDIDRMSNDGQDNPEGTKFSCSICGKVFRRQAYLRKHYASHQNFEAKSSGDPPHFPEKSDESMKYSRRIDDFGDDVKIMEDALQERLLAQQRSGHQEFSAFRLVQNDLTPRKHTHYDLGEDMRDANFNNFWGKVPPGRPLSTNYFADCENTSERSQRNYDIHSAISKSASSVCTDTDDSQTLDITGSEDDTRVSTSKRASSDHAVSKRIDTDQMENN